MDDSDSGGQSARICAKPHQPGAQDHKTHLSLGQPKDERALGLSGVLQSLRRPECIYLLPLSQPTRLIATSKTKLATQATGPAAGVARFKRDDLGWLPARPPTKEEHCYGERSGPCEAGVVNAVAIMEGDSLL